VLEIQLLDILGQRKLPGFMFRIGQVAELFGFSPSSRAIRMWASESWKRLRASIRGRYFSGVCFSPWVTYSVKVVPCHRRFRVFAKTRSLLSLRGRIRANRFRSGPRQDHALVELAGNLPQRQNANQPFYRLSSYEKGGYFFNFMLVAISSKFVQ